MSNLREAVALRMVAAAICIPLVVSRHTLPLATFYGEWASALAFILVVMLAAVLMPLPRPVSWNEQAPAAAGRAAATGVPLVAAFTLWLIGVGLAMIAVGEPDITGSRMLTLITLALAAAVTCAGFRLRHLVDANRFIDAVAMGLLVAALLGTLAQWVQLFGLERSSLGLVSEYFYDTNRRLWGNLNQPNHQATVHGLALAGSVWLASRGLLRVAPWLAAVALLESGIVLSGSRTGMLHVGLAAIYALIAAWFAAAHRADPNRLRRPVGMVFAAVALVAMFAVLQPAIRAAGHTLGWQLFDTMAQLQGGDQTSARRALWEHAWLMFVDHPWLGVGWGEFGWAQFQQLDRLGITVEMSLHAHNALLDLLAKTGLLGTAGTVAILAAWLWRVVHVRLVRGDAGERAGTVAALTWLAMLCAHSMLEYPLHYLYFLLPFCLLLGWLEPAGLRLSWLPRWSPRLAALAVALGAAWVLATMWQDYQRVEAREYAGRDRFDALPMPRYWFRQHADANRAELAQLTSTNAGYWLPRHVAAVHLLPTPTMITRSAWLLALTGRPEQARRWMERLRYYYNGDEAAQFARITRYCDAVDPIQRPQAFCDWAATQSQRKAFAR